MNLLLLNLFTFSFLICATKLFGQNDSNAILEKSLGSWNLPISNIKEIRDIGYRKRAYSFSKADSSLRFVSDSSCNVAATFDGKVVILFKQNKEYYLTTKFGDYYIAYGGLTKPNLKVGDKVTAGQIIARLFQNNNILEYTLDFNVSKFEKSIDAKKWLCP